MARLRLASQDFVPGGTIAEACTCEGANRSPGLQWQSAPEGTRSFVLVVDDPDAPRGLFTHWLVYDIPPDRTELPAGIRPDRDASGGLQGTNDFGDVGYGGPCPPVGDEPHRYFFRLFALDAMLNLPAGENRRAILQAIRGHVLDSTELIATFGRTRQPVGAR